MLNIFINKKIGTFLHDIFITLNKFKLQKNYDINKIDNDENKWNKIISDNMLKFHCKLNIDYLKSTNYRNISDILNYDEYYIYNNNITKELDKKLESYSNITVNNVYKFIFENIKCKWKENDKLIKDQGGVKPLEPLRGEQQTSKCG